MAGDLPGAVLFACTQNAIRSVMASAIMKHFYGHKTYVTSCGVRAGQNDPFVAAVMDEMGIDIGKHRPQDFDDLEDSSFDLVISLSPEAHHRALEMTRTMAIEAEYWPTLDPSITMGAREQILDSYRDVRDQLTRKIRQRFGNIGARGV
jgi:protein-tyrosine-phosphatase